MTTTEANPFNSGEKTISLTFTNHDENGVATPKPIGTRLGGKIIKAPELVQQTKMGSSAKLYWGADSKKTENAVGPNGQPNNPAMSVVTTLETAEGARSLWAPKSSKDGSLCKEIAKAISAAGCKTAEIGGELWVTLVGLTPNPQGGQPSKQYTAQYIPPNNFAAPEVPTAQATPQPPAPAAPPTPAPAPPAPPASPATTPEGYTHASLTAAGWTHEQIIASYPMLGGTPIPPSAPPAPPAAPPAASDRAAALAQLSDADLDMMGMQRLADGSIVNK
jgi:hypothetical protein